MLGWQAERALGRAARKAHPEPATERLRVIGSRLRLPDGEPLDWPERDLRITAIAPLSRAFTRYHALPAQLARTGAARTTYVTPDAQAFEAIGRNVLDPSKREAAAEAGMLQARTMVEKVAVVR